MFETTYRIEAGAPPPLSWDEYKALVMTSWNALLVREPPATEREVQLFLQDHPCLVPGAFGLTGLRNGHYPYACSVIAQAPLPSYNRRVPDFIWLSKNSEVDEPVLIEI